ncbi:hypothetical protein DVH05_026150 [Phytophthora capsici]|nr:hypothetical protein DVH05_026150 [Phytophthora capsici]
MPDSECKKLKREISTLLYHEVLIRDQEEDTMEFDEESRDGWEVFKGVSGGDTLMDIDSLLGFNADYRTLCVDSQTFEEFGEDDGTVLKGDDGPDHLAELYAGIASYRYLNQREYAVRSTSYRDLLFSFGESEFRQYVRVKKTTFSFIMELTQEHSVFHRETNSDKARKPQRDVAIQLAVALEWYGSCCNGNSMGRIARVYKLGAGTVSLYTTSPKSSSSALLEVRVLAIGL